MLRLKIPKSIVNLVLKNAKQIDICNCFRPRSGMSCFLCQARWNTTVNVLLRGVAITLISCKKNEKRPPGGFIAVSHKNWSFILCIGID